MSLLVKDLLKIPVLIIGFIVMSFGIVLLKRSELGLFAWGVFHDGLSKVTPFSFGEITIWLGLIILVLSVIIFKNMFGIGTLLNIGVVGVLIDLIDNWFMVEPSNVLSKIILSVVGILLMTFGRALYISTKLGAGPRDGLFVGLSRITQVDVKYIKPLIEVVVLTVGFALGGVIGIGTIVTMVISGYLVQYFFSILGYDPKTEKQHSFLDYTKVSKKSSVKT